MRPHKSFFGLTLEGFRLKAKPYLDARNEIVELDKQSVRDGLRAEEPALIGAGARGHGREA